MDEIKENKITHDQNFCWVFELPKEFSHDFCFEGGVPTQFLMVDWFNPLFPEDIEAGITPDEWNVDMILNFIMKKPYVRKGYKYLVITRFDKAIILENDLSAGGEGDGGESKRQVT